MQTVDGRELQFEGTGTVNLTVRSVQLKVKTIVMTNIVQCVDMVTGMDMMKKTEGVGLHQKAGCRVWCGTMCCEYSAVERVLGSQGRELQGA